MAQGWRVPYLRGLEMATFSLLGSVTNPNLPSLLHLTVDITMTSASLPCNTWSTWRSAADTTVQCMAVQSSSFPCQLLSYLSLQSLPFFCPFVLLLSRIAHRTLTSRANHACLFHCECSCLCAVAGADSHNQITIANGERLIQWIL